MTTATESRPLSRDGDLRPGDRVLIVDAPSWCRRHFTGRAGQVVRVLPLAGNVWVRFEPPVNPWCERMDPVDVFPFVAEHLAAV